MKSFPPPLSLLLFPLFCFPLLLALLFYLAFLSQPCISYTFLSPPPLLSSSFCLGKHTYCLMLPTFYYKPYDIPLFATEPDLTSFCSLRSDNCFPHL
ncbi:uncharacterized protein LY79DRAFT_572153 [Colletotrichum navitas]|uniref:Uncharacterized protein n=1 Tax=Colletotrichum navitas TaxID=681940 RepID=A0AAD8PL78_9PEZI|nr:uncharacterized protein LY79DRAFT_572153 [Colletotrichum navitas]KAK1566399.1 hypothetical protein LY79DRAFT_572153 [Colletotrichum navitas]